MRKLSYIVLTVIFFIIIGCDGDSYNYNSDGVSNNNEPANCNYYEIERIQVTYQFKDSVTGLFEKPIAHANRIYQHANTAVKQCHDFAIISDLYYNAMGYLNSGLHPDTVEIWFIRNIREFTGYNPLST